ncbi:MAG: YbhN family protein [Candidatus Nanohaloarchaea archaeon]
MNCSDPMNSRIYKLLWFGVSTLIIGGMIYLADVSKFLEAIQRAELLYLALALLLGLSVFPIWAYVWYSFFDTMNLQIPYVRSLKVFMAGSFMNAVTPLGQFGGEPVMAYLISRNTESSYEKAFSTVLSADIVNAVPIFTFVIGGAFYLLAFGSMNQVVVQTLYIALLTTVVGGAAVYLLWFEAQKIETLVVGVMRAVSGALGRGEKYVESAEERLEEVQRSFRTVGENPRHLMKVAAVSHLGHLSQILCLFFVLLSFGHSPDFTPLYFIIALSGLANFSPTPGGSGTFEAAMASLISVFLPVSFATGLSVAIVFRLTTYWPGILLGYGSLNLLEGGDNK